MTIRFQVLLLFILVTMSCPILAQTDRGAIEGLVTDPSGAAVPSAQVQIVQIETNSKIDLATNENGMYFAPNLPLGSYRIILEKKGFHRIVREPVLIRAQTHARVDFTFQVGESRKTSASRVKPRCLIFLPRVWPQVSPRSSS